MNSESIYPLARDSVLTGRPPKVNSKGQVPVFAHRDCCPSLMTDIEGSLCANVPDLLLLLTFCEDAGVAPTFCTSPKSLYATKSTWPMQLVPGSCTPKYMDSLSQLVVSSCRHLGGSKLVQVTKGLAREPAAFTSTSSPTPYTFASH
ncbi:hypothetical protein VNO77_34171 [Canavalia gladiata]|uniref:Uncharacterized protein n=1 Tax=Canavalia gladiata TaxID=3824 RepID=A0AAN9KH35_CANGL